MVSSSNLTRIYATTWDLLTPNPAFLCRRAHRSRVDGPADSSDGAVGERAGSGRDWDSPDNVVRPDGRSDLEAFTVH